MIKSNLLFLIIIIPVYLLMFSCKNRNEEKAVSGNFQTEDHETVTFKAIDNYRFSFRFDIPESWKAVDSSDNGDGFFIIPEEDPGNADIRIYGSYLSLIDNEYENEYDEFLFMDGSKGRIYSDYNTLVIEKRKGDSYVIMSVYTDDRQWLVNHHELLMKTGRSIRWIRDE